MKWSFLLFACFVSFSLHAQDTLKIFPGSSEILYSKIKPHVIKSHFSVVRNNQRKELGVFKDSIVFIKKNGKEFLVRYSFFPASNMQDTAFYIPKTLAPVSNTEYSSKGVMQLAYFPDRVTGKHTIKTKAKDSVVVIDERMSSAYFDGYVNDFLPRFLKLKENYCAKIPLYAFGKAGVTWITATVLRSEKIIARNTQSYDVWVIEVLWPKSPFKVNLFVEKESRDLLKIHSMGPGIEIIKERIDF